MPKAKASATISAVEKEMTPDIVKKPAVDLNGYDKNPNAEPLLRIGGVEIELQVCAEPPMFYHRPRFMRTERDFGYSEGEPLGNEDQVIYQAVGKVGSGIYLTKGSVVQIDSADQDPCLVSEQDPVGVLLVDGSWIKTDRLSVRPGTSSVTNSKIICERNLVLQKASINKSLLDAKRITVNQTTIISSELRADNMWFDDAWLRKAELFADKRIEVRKGHIRSVYLRSWSGSIDINISMADFDLTVENITGNRNITIRHRLQYGQIGTNSRGRYVCGDEGVMLFNGFSLKPHEILGSIQPASASEGNFGYMQPMPLFQQPASMQAEATKPKPGEKLFDEYLILALDNWSPRRDPSDKVATPHPAVVELVDDIHRQIFSRMRALQLVRHFVE